MYDTKVFDVLIVSVFLKEKQKSLFHKEAYRATTDTE